MHISRLYLFVNYIFRASRAKLLYFIAAILKEVDTYYIAHHNCVINRISTSSACARAPSDDASPAISIDRNIREFAFLSATLALSVPLNSHLTMAKLRSGYHTFSYSFPGFGKNVALVLIFPAIAG